MDVRQKIKGDRKMREEVMAIVEDIKKYNKTTLAFFADEDKLVNEIIDEMICSACLHSSVADSPRTSSISLPAS